MKPVKLGNGGLPDEILREDRKKCRRFGPCGVGEQALYLNSFYIERRFYVPLKSVTRVFKRIAMSRGGFTGKGLFATMAYLVVVYDGGKEKQCNFKYEEQIDQLLMYLSGTQPQIRLVSEEAEKRLAKREAERAARKLPALSAEAKESVARLSDAKSYLENRPELSLELSQSARRKRAFLQGKPSYRQAAMAITLLGAAALLYGIVSMMRGNGGFSIYFTLFGLAAIFLFSGFSVLPTAENNRKAVMKRADRAVSEMDRYLHAYGKSPFPLPARYAHPVVLSRMVRSIEEGQAVTEEEALAAVKAGLRALNADVEVDQDEYDEVVAVKAMFLNEDYR